MAPSTVEISKAAPIPAQLLFDHGQADIQEIVGIERFRLDQGNGRRCPSGAAVCAHRPASRDRRPRPQGKARDLFQPPGAEAFVAGGLQPSESHRRAGIQLDRGFQPRDIVVGDDLLVGDGGLGVAGIAPVADRVPRSPALMIPVPAVSPTAYSSGCGRAGAPAGPDRHGRILKRGPGSTAITTFADIGRRIQRRDFRRLDPRSSVILMMAEK